LVHVKCLIPSSPFGIQDSLPVVPPGCSPENPESIQDFMSKAKAALVAVGIVRDKSDNSTGRVSILLQ